MMDIGTVVSLFEIALGAGVLLFLVLIFSSMYRTFGDFMRALTCPDYYALNSIFLRGKRLPYVTDFPNDLRRACLVKDTYYADKPGDKAMNKSEHTKVPWEQKDFVAFMIKLGINSGKFKGVKESTVGTYSTEIQKNMDTELCEYSVHLQKLMDTIIRRFLEKQ